MKNFSYVITDAEGIHARPAGILVKEAGKYTSKVTLKANGKSADAKRLFGIMSLGVKCNTTVEIEVEGEDEDAAVVELEKFFKENL